MRIPEPLTPDQLYTKCDPEDLPRSGETDEVSDDLGQERALDAVRFGIGIRRHGYNIFVYGPPGTGKYPLARRQIEQAAAAMPVPPDWCYVHNFQETHKPRALRLPAGRGCRLRGDMETLIRELRATIPAAFESEDYQARAQSLQSQFSQRQEAAFNELQERAKALNVGLIRTPSGLALAPTSKGEVVNPEAFRQWPEDMQEKIRSDIAELEKELQEILKKLPQWDRERREQLRGLNQEVVSQAVGQLIEELSKDYDDLPDVIDYIEQVRADLLENGEEFRGPEPTEPQQAARGGPREPSFRRYQVNVIVDNGRREGAPVVYEDLPTHGNIIGRIEQMAQFGTLTTDFGLIKPGALHAANGGYLMVDARKLFMQPIIWEEIKRALQANEIRIHGLTEALGFANTVTLQPQPIPLDVKVVLLGDPTIYYLLSRSDPDFPELFKVAADFDDQLPRNHGNTARYGQMIADTARARGCGRSRGTPPRGSSSRRPGSPPTPSGSLFACGPSTISSTRRTTGLVWAAAGKSPRNTCSGPSTRRSAGPIASANAARSRSCGRPCSSTPTARRWARSTGSRCCSSVSSPSASPAGSPPGSGWAGARCSTSSGRSSWAGRFIPRACSSSRASSARGSPAAIRWHCRPASCSSSPMAAWTATARPPPSSTRSCRPCPGCPSGSPWRSPDRSTSSARSRPSAASTRRSRVSSISARPGASPDARGC